MEVRIASSWKKQLAHEFMKPYFHHLVEFIRTEYVTHKVYPSGKELFRAFDMCSFDDTKIVIIGQDPYHGVGQANGLCFSVGGTIPLPPSLINIFKEVSSDVGVKMATTGDLGRWASQGVLLLNAMLTVRDSSPSSHRNKGWETFTDAVIDIISKKKKHVVFLLWGAYAQQKKALIDHENHCVLTSSHPSPFSVHRGFFGCRHFSQSNSYLQSKGRLIISW